jgi:hypothetical protein
MIRRSFTAVASSLAVVMIGGASLADAERPATLAPGDLSMAVAGGGVSLDRDWTWGLEASVRAGLPLGLEFALPLALAVDIHSTEAGSGLVLAGGAVDMWVAGDGPLLWTPAIILAARIRAASTASVRAAVDLTGIEEGLGAEDHPWWLRSSLALLIDMGPYLTVAAGMAYQRHMFGGWAPEAARRAGWAGRDARISIGAVRSQPFEDLPTIAVHVTSWLAVIALVRLDIDTDTDTVDARYMGGLRLDLSGLGRGD